MSNLKLTPQDRQSIDFAEEERLRFEAGGGKDRAVIDASNLSEENVASWREKLIDTELSVPKVVRYGGGETDNGNNEMVANATSLENLLNFLKNHPNNTYFGRVGKQDPSNNLKTLLGNAGDGNYTAVSLKYFGQIGTTVHMAEAFAVGLYITKLYSGYIYFDNTGTRWTGWQARQ